MPTWRTTAAILVAGVLGHGTARADTATRQPCDIGYDRGQGECPRFLAPAVIASSSVQSFLNLGFSGIAHWVPVPAYAGASSQTLTQYQVSGSPSVGARFGHYLMVFGGADGGVTMGGNEGSLIGGGAQGGGDGYLGGTLQIPWDNVRAAITGRVLWGRQEAIETEAAVEGVSSNFLVADLQTAIKELGGAVGSILVPVDVTSGRVDATFAYAWRAMTLQGAIGVGSARDDFPSARLNTVGRVSTLAAPRIGFALGIDTNGMLHTSRLVLPEVQLEYQITSLHNWVSVAGGPPATVSPPISENVLAVGVYTARRQHPDLQLGITGIFRYGGEVSLLTAGTPDAGDARPHDFGLVTSFRYLF